MAEGRVAVVGCGRWGQNLLRDFVGLLGVEGVIACDAAEATRERVAATYPGIEVVEDAAAAFADPSVVAVAVATNVPSHYRVASSAIAAGKHVLVEKPLAATVAEAEALVDEAGRAGVVLTVDHLLLADPAFEGAARLVREGAIGTLQHIYARRTNLGVVRAEENALWSLGPHDVAVMLRAFGDSPVHVSASGGAWVQAGIEDAVFVALEFPRGRLGHIHLSWLDPSKTRAVTFVGSEAMAIVDDGAADRLTLHRRRAFVGEDGLPRVEDAGSEGIPIGTEQPLTSMCRQFLDCVHGRGPNPSDGALGLEVVRVLAQAQAALDEGRGTMP